MRGILAAVLVLHGLIHVMGFAKAFGFAALPQLAEPISRAWGLAWLAAAALVLVSAAAYAAGHRLFYLWGGAALVISQIVVVSSWRDARAGTVANALLLVLVVHAWLTQGPYSFRAQMARDAAAPLATPMAASLVSEADLVALPEPVGRYLRLAGVIGQPQVHHYRLRFRGRIRDGQDSRWMPFTAEQVSGAQPPARLFLMSARMYGVPVEAFHRCMDGHATMQVKLAGLFTIVNAGGTEMDRAETVTVFNDMCLLAPATLIDPAILWEPIDGRSARARWTHGGHTVSATLLFGEDGLLKDFVSDDRFRSLGGGKFVRQRFSTPVRDYRWYGPVRLPAHGEARWHPPEGAFTYGEFELLDVSMNAGR